MKKQLAILSASVLVAGGFALPVSAHEGEAEEQHCDGRTITVSAPKSQATVGRTFALTGKVSTPANYPDGNEIFIQIDDLNYVAPANRNIDPNNPNATYSVPVADQNGNFSITIDLIGNGVVEDYNENGIYRKAVTAGTHQFRVGIYGNICPGEVVDPLTLTVRDDAMRNVASSQSQAISKVKPNPSPVLSPSPSVAPVMATDDAEGKEPDNGLDPAVALGLGALLGAALLSLAEVSALEYRRKHGAAASKAVRKK